MTISREFQDEAQHSLTEHTNVVPTLAFSYDARLLASGSWDRSIRLWDVRTGQAIGGPITGAEMPITGHAFSHDVGLLLVATLNGEVVVWDIELGRLRASCRNLIRSLMEQPGASPWTLTATLL